MAEKPFQHRSGEGGWYCASDSGIQTGPWLTEAEARKKAEFLDSISPKTMKVRMCVAVSADGKFDVVGWTGATNEEMLESAMDHEYHRWVEADIPLPVEATIQGKVVEGSEGE